MDPKLKVNLLNCWLAPKDKDGDILYFCYCQTILWKDQNQ